ncbi:MAG: DUF6597 domain-containing transcriptional factor [Eubacteriales bacterium]
MNNNLYKYFQPLVIKNNKIAKKIYKEYIPNEKLRPYICCFWTSKIDFILEEKFTEVVVPDGCMDIICFKNIVTNKRDNIFVGISDHVFYDMSTCEYEIFAIRFYPWAAHLFINDKMKNWKNNAISLDDCWHSLSTELNNIMEMNLATEEKIHIIESFLYKKILVKNEIKPDVLNAMYKMLASSGTISIKEIADYICSSTRQLERNFNDYIGLTPKTMVGVIRFQNVLREILNKPNINWLDLVSKYNYTDQSHLIRDFRKYYGKAPTELVR